MRWAIDEGPFCLVGLPGVGELAKGLEAADLAALAEPPAQLVCEADETTLLVRESRLAGLLERHPDARVERGLFWVRFEMAMSWELVGFLARVCGALAAAGVPLGAVCGFSRDHLFIEHGHLAATRRVLDELFPGAGRAGIQGTSHSSNHSNTGEPEA